MKSNRIIKGSYFLNIVLILILAIFSIYFLPLKKEVTKSSQEDYNLDFDFTTYGNYSDRNFKENISQNLIDQTLKKQSFQSTQEAIKCYTDYQNSWENELDKTISAIIELKNDPTLDNYEDVVKLADALDTYYMVWKEYLDNQLEVEAEFFRNHYSSQKSSISFNHACEIRNFTLKLKEYYYNITGKVVFYYDEYVK